MRMRRGWGGLVCIAYFCSTVMLPCTSPASYAAAKKAPAAKKSTEPQVLKDFGLAVDYYNLGVEAGDSKNYPLALSYYQMSRKADPGLVATYNNEGCAYNAMKRPDLAVAILTAGMKVDKKNKEADQKYWELFHNRGLAYLELKQFDKAVADFTTCMDHEPAESRAMIQAVRGAAYAEMGEYQKCFNDKNSVLRLTATDNWTANARYLANVTLQEARRKMQHEIARQLSEASSLTDKAQYDKALALADRAVKIDPQNTTALIARGTCYAFMQQKDKFEAGLAAAQKLSPKDGKVLALKGYVYLSTHETDAALNNLIEAKKLNYSTPQLYAAMSTAYLLKENFDDALSSINEAIRLSPADADLYNTRSLSYLVMGKPENSLSDANRYLETTEWKGAHTVDCFLRVYMLSKQIANEIEAGKALDQAGKSFTPEQPEHRLLAYLKGEMDDAALLAAARGAEEETNSHAWIGIKCSIAGDKDKALSELGTVRASGSKRASCATCWQSFNWLVSSVLTNPSRQLQ